MWKLESKRTIFSVFFWFSLRRRMIHCSFVRVFVRRLTDGDWERTAAYIGLSAARGQTQVMRHHRPGDFADVMLSSAVYVMPPCSPDESDAESLAVSFSHVLTTQTHYSMALWLATCFSVLKTLCLALFITTHPAADVSPSLAPGFSLKWSL